VTHPAHTMLQACGGISSMLCLRRGTMRFYNSLELAHIDKSAGSFQNLRRAVITACRLGSDPSWHLLSAPDGRSASHVPDRPSLWQRNPNTERGRRRTYQYELAPNILSESIPTKKVKDPDLTPLGACGRFTSTSHAEATI
jgi:hypothetical protein